MPVEMYTQPEIDALQAAQNARIGDLEDGHRSQDAQLANHGDALVDILRRLDALENGTTPQPPAGIPLGIRGMWLQRNQNNAESVRAAHDLGANAVFIFSGTGRGVTFDNARGIPSSGEIDAVLEEAIRLGVDVYPALPSKYFWRESHPEQDIIGDLGITNHWLDFRNSGARALMAGLCADLAKYPVAGICADYTRWDRAWYADSGLTSTPITATIAAMHNALEGTGVPLCASPISILDGGEYDACEGYGQCWPDWFAQGAVECAYPMTYYGEHLEVRISEWGALWPQMVTPILSPVKWSGGSTEIQKTDEDFRQEFITLWERGGRGVSMFDLNTVQKYPSKAAILTSMW